LCNLTDSKIEQVGSMAEMAKAS